MAHLDPLSCTLELIDLDDPTRHRRIDCPRSPEDEEDFTCPSGRRLLEDLGTATFDGLEAPTSP